MLDFEFTFPPLGHTGKGDVDTDHVHGEVYWLPEPYNGYYVTYQGDRPAVAFRCHYPKGSSPCNKETADAFIKAYKEWKDSV